MNDDSLLGGVLGQLGQTVKQAAKQVVKIPEEMAQTAGGQVGGGKSQENPAEKKPQQQWQSDEERINFLKDLYGSSKQNPSSYVPDKSASSAKASISANASADRPAAKPDEQKELMQLRQKLHKEVYYDPTFNRPKKQEERPAEKVENEKKKEMMDLQKKEDKKPKPLAVTREQNKAEMFRGASG